MDAERPQRKRVGQGATRRLNSPPTPKRKQVSLPRGIAEAYQRGLRHGILLASGTGQMQSPQVNPQVEQKFRTLAEKWYLDTMPLSSYLDKILHPAYQKILTLGEDVVPFILRELQDMPNDWFFALRILTDDDPVKPEQAGQMAEMAEAWLQWGRERGLV